MRVVVIVKYGITKYYVKENKEMEKRVRKAVKLKPEFFGEIVDRIVLSNVMNYVGVVVDSRDAGFKKGMDVVELVKRIRDRVYSEMIENSWYMVVDGYEYVEEHILKDTDETVFDKCVRDFCENVIITGFEGWEYNGKPAVRLVEYFNKDIMSDVVYEGLKNCGYVLDEAEIDVDKWYTTKTDLVWQDWVDERRVDIPAGSEIKLNTENEFEEYVYVKIKGSDKEECLYIPEFRTVHYKLMDDEGYLVKEPNIFDIIFG